MYGPAIFLDIVRKDIKNDDAIIGRKVFGICLNFCRKIIHYTFGILHLIHRKLQSYGTIFLQHIRKMCTHFVVRNIVTYYYHQNWNEGYC